MNQYQNQFEYNLALASFIMGIMNYQENLTQNDKQELMDNSSKIQDQIINKIDAHLQMQDKKINEILKRLDRMEARNEHTYSNN